MSGFAAIHPYCQHSSSLWILTYSSEVWFTKLVSRSGSKSLLRGQICSRGMSMTYSNLCWFGKRQSVKVLTNDTFHMASIAWDMLQTHFVGGSTNPVCGMSASISKNILFRLITNNKSPACRSSCIKTDGMSGPCLRSCLFYLDTSILNNGLIDPSSRHPKEIIFSGHKPSVPG